VPDQPLPEDKIALEHVGEWTVVRPMEPSLMDTKPIEALTSRVESLVAGGEANLVLDLREVKYISSSMIGALLAARKAANARGGQVILAGLSDALRQLLTLVKLDKLFKIEPDVRTALVNVGALN
jgi:anti-sigma B factor antagonist